MILQITKELSFNYVAVPRDDCLYCIDLNITLHICELMSKIILETHNTLSVSKYCKTEEI